MRILKNIKYLTAAAIIMSLIPACGNGTDSASYPQEAYNNPIGEAIASSAYVNNGDSGLSFATGVNAESVLIENGLESVEENQLYSILGDNAFINDGCSYYYKTRVFSDGGNEVISPVVYVIPYDNNKLIISSLTQYSDGGETVYYTYYGYSYLSYQYTSNNDSYKLVTKSNMIMACVIKTVYSLSYATGSPITTEITADWQYQIAPYFDDCISCYLNGVEIPENVCIKEISVTNSNNEICKLKFSV